MSDRVESGTYPADVQEEIAQKEYEKAVEFVMDILINIDPDTDNLRQQAEEDVDHIKRNAES